MWKFHNGQSGRYLFESEVVAELMVFFTVRRKNKNHLFNVKNTKTLMQKQLELASASQLLLGPCAQGSDLCHPMNTRSCHSTYGNAKSHVSRSTSSISLSNDSFMRNDQSLVGMVQFYTDEFMPSLKANVAFAYSFHVFVLRFRHESHRLLLDYGHRFAGLLPISSAELVRTAQGNWWARSWKSGSRCRSEQFFASLYGKICTKCRAKSVSRGNTETYWTIEQMLGTWILRTAVHKKKGSVFQLWFCTVVISAKKRTCLEWNMVKQFIRAFYV